MSLLLSSRSQRIQFAQSFDGSTSGIGFGVQPSQAVTAQTILSVQKRNRAGENEYHYVFSSFTGSTSGVRWSWSGGYGGFQLGFSSTGAASAPYKNSATGTTSTDWMVAAGTWDGGLLSSGINLYYALNNNPLTLVTNIPVSGNGSGTPLYGSGNSSWIGDRDDRTRTFGGDIAYVARWNRVLSLEELRRAQRLGPLSVPHGLILCWANGRDYGPYHLRPTSVTAVTKAIAPPIAALNTQLNCPIFVEVSGVAFQFARPSTDVSDGAWLATTGSDLYAMLDETAADDADLIYTFTSASECEVKFGSIPDPAVSTDHIVRYRLKGDGTSGITVALRQGSSTEITSWTHDPAPSSWTTYEQTLTGGQADSITDYADLRLRFTEV